MLRQAGIIHCDLKPENVLLASARAAECRVIDFGSACFEVCIEGHLMSFLFCKCDVSNFEAALVQAMPCDHELIMINDS